MASLFVIRGRDQGKRFELDRDCITIGRDSSNSVQLHDSEVSRRHAEIHCQEGHYWIVDLGSSNGTFVNGQRVERQLLKSGDRLQIGRTLIVYTAPEQPASAIATTAVDIVSQADHAALSQSRIVSTLGEQSALRHGDPNWLVQAHGSLEIMYRVALAVSHTLDIDELLQRILDLIFEWVRADRGCIMLLDPQTEQLRPAARKDRTGTGQDALAISRTILDYVLEHHEGVLTSNAGLDERWDPAASIVSQGVHEAICVPMQGRYGVVGVIYIDTYTPPGRALLEPGATRFNQDHLKLMVAIAHQAALAIEDTFYYSALLQAERLAAVGQTIATLSHHIKNILQGIRGGSFLIEEGLKANDPEIIRKGWAIVEKNQERISNLVMDMLTYSKPRKPELVLAQINDVVADVVELMQLRAKEAGVALEFEPYQEMPLLRFDPEAMHRAVLNVVTNAIDACEKVEGGRVVVLTQLDPQQHVCRILVKDNGEGIPLEDQEKIFSVFESRKGARGTGLGLPVSRKILREHGGDVTVESQPGRGSTFALVFPAFTEEQPQVSDQSSHGSAQPPDIEAWDEPGTRRWPHPPDTDTAGCSDSDAPSMTSDSA
ncbi:MAG: peptide-binding protein [Pirellulaceae bacterium]|nr:MAG: peptide-binding protein [Pirellulaceae bacterium]